MGKGKPTARAVVALVLAVAAFWALSVPAVGQEPCAVVCGDVNHDGAIDLPDFAYLRAYLLQEGPPPPCLDEAEYDDAQLVTIQDMVDLAAWLFGSYPPPNCPPSAPPLVPTTDQFSYLQARLCDMTVNPGRTSLTVPLLFYDADRFDAFVFPLKFRIGDDVPSLAVEPVGNIAAYLDGDLIISTDDSGRVMIGGVSVWQHPPQGRLYPLANVTLTFPSSPSPRPLTIEWATYPPEQEGVEVMIPMLAKAWEAPTAPPLVIRYCTMRGDFDGDAMLTISDLTRMVDCLFLDCFYDCPEFLDIDGSGSLNIADVVYLVAYIFQNGPVPPPC